MGREVVSLNEKNSPFYIDETSSGVFYPIEKLEFTKSGLDLTAFPGPELILGRDIIETPTQGLCLCVEHHMGSSLLRPVVNELRKLAQVSWHEFVSCYDGFIPVGRDGSLIYYKIKPRLFRKIVHD
jgi:hypothetical protein